jgi:hypothetical protein
MLPKKVTLQIGEPIFIGRDIPLYAVKGDWLEFNADIYSEPVVVGTKLECYLSLSYNWAE